MDMLRVAVILEKGSKVSLLNGQAHQKMVKPYSSIDLRLDALSKEERDKVLAMVTGNSMIYVRTTDDGEVLDFGLDGVTEREKWDVSKMLEKLDEVLEGLNVSHVVTKLNEMLAKLQSLDLTRLENLDNIEDEGLNGSPVVTKLDLTRLENLDNIEEEGLNGSPVVTKLDLTWLENFDNIEEEGLNGSLVVTKLDEMLAKLQSLDRTWQRLDLTYRTWQSLDLTRLENLDNIEEGLNGSLVEPNLDEMLAKLQSLDLTRLENLDNIGEEGLNGSLVITKLDQMLEKLQSLDVNRVENLDNIEEGGIDIRKYIIFCVIAFAGGYTLGRFGNKASFTVGCQFLAATNLKAINDFFKPAIKSAFEVFKKEVGRTLLNKLSLS